MKRLLIYLAAPLYVDGEFPKTPGASAKARTNIERVMDYAEAVQACGHWPLVPHLSHYFERYLRQVGRVGFGRAWWLEFDQRLLSVCDALLYVGMSPGADAELRAAQKLGLRVYRRVEQIPHAE